MNSSKIINSVDNKEKQKEKQNLPPTEISYLIREGAEDYEVLKSFLKTNKFSTNVTAFPEEFANTLEKNNSEINSDEKS